MEYKSKLITSNATISLLDEEYDEELTLLSLLLPAMCDEMQVIHFIRNIGVYKCETPPSEIVTISFETQDDKYQTCVLLPKSWTTEQIRDFISPLTAVKSIINEAARCMADVAYIDEDLVCSVTKH